MQKVPKAGGPIITLASGQGDIRGLVVDANYAYWTDEFANAVVRSPIGGGGIFGAVAVGASPAGIAVDSIYVYWTTALSSGELRRAFKNASSNAGEVLVSPLSYPSDIVMVPPFILWMADDGTISSYSISTTKLTVLAKEPGAHRDQPPTASTSTGQTAPTVR